MAASTASHGEPTGANSRATSTCARKHSDTGREHARGDHRTMCNQNADNVAWACDSPRRRRIVAINVALAARSRQRYSRRPWPRAAHSAHPRYTPAQPHARLRRAASLCGCPVHRPAQRLQSQVGRANDHVVLQSTTKNNNRHAPTQRDGAHTWRRPEARIGAARGAARWRSPEPRHAGSDCRRVCHHLGVSVASGSHRGAPRIPR